ncbi:MAG: DUF6236 family protein [Bacteroidota bacterium]
MSLLAKYLADISKSQTTIGTDHAIYEKFNFGTISENQPHPVISMNLSGLIPDPTSEYFFEKLIDFKKNRQDNLLHFRKLLMDFYSKISKAKSNEEFKELTIAFKENIKIGIKDLSSAMKDAKIEALFKSLKSLINFKSPTLIASGALVADQRFNLIDAPLSLKFLALR